ncbi:MAG: serine/threonine-protein phosphatase [Kiritimatiellae bacterium]|nr:serine/threonine-protein phosphatase [Kiritimatiellia bacterium]
MRKTVLGLLPSALVAAGLGISFLLTIFSWRVCAVREARHELARLGLEDVASRVERSVANLKSVRGMSDAVALSRARALAQLIAENPAVLDAANRAKFNSYASLLGVDEMHVSDEKGVLVRSLPALYEGFNMAGSAQSAAFMPAITNAAFEFVQDPTHKGLATVAGDTGITFFQYAGVARKDRPGIVEIGYRASRLAEAMRLADIDEIAATTRIGHDGRVKIVKVSPGCAPRQGYRLETASDGTRIASFETECGGYRIIVQLPEVASSLADEGVHRALVVLDLTLLLLVIVSLPSVRRLLSRDVREIRNLLSEKGAGRSSFLQSVVSPLSLISLVFFGVMLWIISVSSAHVAERSARERLRAAATDMVDELDDCVNGQLAFVASEICARHKTPEAMAGVDLRGLMASYFVDEINVVDGNGTCLASSVDAVCGQNQWSLANPSNFCQALIKDGREVFSQPFRQSAMESGVFRKYVGVAFPAPAKGYLQVGFDRSRMRSSIDYHLRTVAAGWHLGESGFYVIAKTGTGKIVSTLDEQHVGKTLAEVGFDAFAANMHQNVEKRDPVSREFVGFEKFRTFKSNFAGVPCLCTSGVVNQFHRYVAAMPLSEVYGPTRRVVARTAVLLFVAFAVVVFFMSRQSNLVASLREKEREERKRQQEDLAVARTIQESSLPVSFPDEPRCKIFARMDAAREVGGDFYDFYPLPDGRLFFAVADVSGKGVPAAMFMMKARTTIKACMFECADFAKAVAEANNRLAAENAADMFVTCWMGIFDKASGDVRYVNAGHNPPLVKRADGSVEWVQGQCSIALAVMPGATYREETLHLAPGDSLFLYTDGVTEAVDVGGAFYGDDRLAEKLKNCGSEFVAEVRRDVAAFAEGAEQSDDITLLALDVKGTPEIS